MSIKEFFSFKTNKFFWWNIIAMMVVAAGALVGTLKWMDVYTRHGEAVIVPDVRDMGEEEARTVFQRCGLTCVVSDTRYVKNKAAGVVLDLKPEAGEKVKQGRVVYLTLNTQEVPLRVVPDVADNSSLRQAQARLLGAGFKLNQVRQVNGEKDWVYGVEYQGRAVAAGDKVPMGAALTLLVGDGADGDEQEMDSQDLSGELPAVSESSSEQEDDSWF